MKKIVLLLLSLLLIFTLCACDDNTVCTEHSDTDKDLKCDVCGATVEAPDDGGDENDDGTPLVLVENSEAKFQIVISKMSGTKLLNTVKNFVADMKKLGVEIKYVNNDNEENIEDCEIILGDVASRGDKYDFDEYTLGIKGYVIKRIDNKIIITGGSTDTIIDAFEDFTKDVLGLKKGAKKSDVANSEFKKDDAVLKVQDDYRVTAIKIGDTEITGYTIATDMTDSTYKNVALTLQKNLYERAGYWLPVVSLDEATNKSIVIQHVEKGADSPAGSEGFRVKTTNGRMDIYCAYDNSLAKSVNAIISKLLTTQGEYVFEDNKVIFKNEVSVVYYKDWKDIKGDGVTNDFEAIKALHDFANEGGQKVVAEDYKTYYIEKTGGQSIIIKTDVHFGKANFIIDDRFITDTQETAAERGAELFIIKSNYETMTFTLNNDPYQILERINAAGGLPIGTTEIPLNLGFDAMIIPYDTSKRIYKRWGRDEYGNGKTGEGEEMNEIIVVDKNNKVDMKTTNMFDFDTVDKIKIYRIDENVLTITGGTFTTIATRNDLPWNYIDRNIYITRSNVLITGLEHIVENEPTGDGGQSTMGSTGTGLLGPNYSGFIYPANCTGFTLKDSKLSGRVHYNNGSYDIGGNHANDLNYINVTQYNMFDENGKLYDENTKYWGIMGSNYCKNITFDGCELSRFDAHAGVYNFTIKNTKIGFIKAVGGGTAEINNVTIYNTTLVTLREDYASTWTGDFIIKDVTMVNDGESFVLFGGNIHDVEFGLYSTIPNIYVENVNTEKYNGDAHNNFNLSLWVLRVDATLNNKDGIGIYNRITPSQSIIIKQPAGREIKIDTPFEFKYYDKIEFKTLGEDE